MIYANYFMLDCFHFRFFVFIAIFTRILHPNLMALCNDGEREAENFLMPLKSLEPVEQSKHF